jgi:DNA replication protein DnaC
MERDAEERKRREADEIQRVMELSRYSLSGDKIRNARFENAVMREDMVRPVKIAKRYVENWDAISSGKTEMNGLLFYGPQGTGKTFLAACIANALMDRLVPVLFTSVIRLTGTYPDEMAEVHRGIKTAKLLVLDDLGAERATAYKLEQVYDIINERCNAGKPIVVTTNYDRQQLSRLNGGDDVNFQQHNRIFERVKEQCYPVLMNGASWRKEKAKAARESMRAILEG